MTHRDPKEDSRRTILLLVALVDSTVVTCNGGGTDTGLGSGGAISGGTTSGGTTSGGGVTTTGVGGGAPRPKAAPAATEAMKDTPLPRWRCSYSPPWGCCSVGAAEYRHSPETSV